jgi:hypothetical protein
MIHALVADSRGHKTHKTFTSPEAMTQWSNGQKRTHRGMTIASTLSSDVPSVRVLETRAKDYGLSVTRCSNGFSWATKKDGAGYFPTRPAALRAAFNEGVLGE